MAADVHLDVKAPILDWLSHLNNGDLLSCHQGSAISAGLWATGPGHATGHLSPAPVKG